MELLLTEEQVLFRNAAAKLAASKAARGARERCATRQRKSIAPPGTR